MTEVAPVLGVLAGVCAVANTIPYIRDIVRGTTRPHRGTWLVWAVLAIVVYASQRAGGASWSLLMSGAQALLTGLVFILAIRRGVGGLSATDVCSPRWPRPASSAGSSATSRPWPPQRWWWRTSWARR